MITNNIRLSAFCILRFVVVRNKSSELVIHVAEPPRAKKEKWETHSLEKLE